MGVASDIPRGHSFTKHFLTLWFLQSLWFLLHSGPWVQESFCRCILWAEVYNSAFWLIVGFGSDFCLFNKTFKQDLKGMMKIVIGFRML